MNTPSCFQATIQLLLEDTGSFSSIIDPFQMLRWLLTQANGIACVPIVLDQPFVIRALMHKTQALVTQIHNSRRGRQKAGFCNSSQAPPVVLIQKHKQNYINRSVFLDSRNLNGLAQYLTCCLADQQSTLLVYLKKYILLDWGNHCVLRVSQSYSVSFLCFISY